MTDFLLDTNVLSEVKRSSPSRLVLEFFARTPKRNLFVSSVTIAEIRYGIWRSNDPEQVRMLEIWLRDKVRPMFAGTSLEVTKDVMLRWRILVDEGRKYPQPDLIIAAIALEHGMTLVTRNVKDFDGLGLAIVNPWEPQAYSVSREAWWKALRVCRDAVGYLLFS